uniref:response regulator n=1 Tax=Calothrix sp. NIES-2100 TaxID=1954172 RepID=UPI0030DB7480
MRDYLKRLLQQHWQVQAVANGADALNAISLQPPDLVLTDVMMPEMDGFQLLSALRTNPKTKEVLKCRLMLLNLGLSSKSATMVLG